MKYSLKNKEFNKKRLPIFDRLQRTSRSRRISHTPPKESDDKQQVINNHYQIKIKPPNLNNSAIDRLNSFDSQRYNNDCSVKKNQEDFAIFQSFAKTNNFSSLSYRSFGVNNSKTIKINKQMKNGQALSPSEPLKIISTRPLQIQQSRNDTFQQDSNKNESFQVCNQINNQGLRGNRFFTQIVQGRLSESPQSKVVFQPVIRNSRSKSPQKLSPTQVQRQTSNISNQYNINLQNRPQLLSSNNTYSYTPLTSKVVFEQKPQSIIKISPLKQQRNTIHVPVQLMNNFSKNNEFVQPKNMYADQISSLKRQIQDQNLQILYLKNQKQILQSNIQLKFSPKKGNYQNASFQRNITPEKYGTTNQNHNQIDRNQIIQLAQLLQSNQVRINYFQNKYNNVYHQIHKKFNSSIFHCQQKLIQIFAQKYARFSQQLNIKLSIIDKKHNQLSTLDTKIDIFTNTLRNIFENLRITKLKQQNIELIIQNQHKKTDKFWNTEEPSRLLYLENQSDISSIRRFDDNQIQEKQRDELYKLSKNIKTKNMSKSPKKQENSQFQNFLNDKYSHLVYQRKKQLFKQNSIMKKNIQRQSIKTNLKPTIDNFQVFQIYEDKYNKSTSQQIEQFSPFQANQMFQKQNNDVFKRKNLSDFQKLQDHSFHDIKDRRKQNRLNLSFENGSSKNYDFDANSFEADLTFKQKPRQQTTKQISFNSHTMFKKVNSKSSSQNDYISDTLEGQQERLINILHNKKYSFPVDCWLDELGCLRKKNQTYIFDEQGSVIITTASAFKKLKQRKVLL